MSLRPQLRRVVTFCVCRYWVVARLVTGRVRAHSCVRETCVRLLHAAWGVTICRSSLPFARGCRVGVWFGFVGAALLPAVGKCVVLAFGAMPGRCCFLRVTHANRLVHIRIGFTCMTTTTLLQGQAVHTCAVFRQSRWGLSTARHLCTIPAAPPQAVLPSTSVLG